MYIPFESLPPASRVWIYQASRPFSAQELPAVHQHLRSFTDEWSVHGVPMETSYSIVLDQFIVLAANEAAQTASGCSIDSSVRALKGLEQSLGLSLFDRNLIAFKKADEVIVVPLAELKEKFVGGILNADTLTFNHLVSTKEEFEARWITRVAETWLKRYMPNPLAKVS